MQFLNSMESYDKLERRDIEPDYNAIAEYYAQLFNKRTINLNQFYEYYFTYLKRKNIYPVQPENNKLILNKLFDACFGDGKGVAIVGNAGIGKSTYFDYVNSINADNFDNNKHRIKNISIRQIASAYQTGGLKEVEQLCSPVFNSKIDAIYIDDLGKEEPIMNSYGNKQDVMKKVIDFRYNIFKDSNSKYKFFFTSNLHKTQLLQRYSEVYFSRLFEMCEILTIKGENLRYRL